MLRKQHKVDEYHNDMPLIYYVEGHSLHFGRPEFALITGMRFGTTRFCSYTSADLKFRNRVFPHKVGLVVTILDVLGVIEDEVMFGNLCDEDSVRLCLILALEVIFMGRLLTCPVDDSLFGLVENLEAWNVFPWGEHVWTQLYDSIKNVVVKHSDTHYLGLKKDRNYVPTYTLTGFVFAFQSLLKEVIVGGLMPLKLYQEQLDGLKSPYSKDLIVVTFLQRTQRQILISDLLELSMNLRVGEVTQTSCFKRSVNFLRGEIRHAIMNIDHLNGLIEMMEVMEFTLELYDSVWCLREMVKAENKRLLGLNKHLVDAEEDIRAKEGLSLDKGGLHALMYFGLIYRQLEHESELSESVSETYDGPNFHHKSGSTEERLANSV
ncbi:phospholipase-like protein [Tanacetum coccineum]